MLSRNKMVTSQETAQTLSTPDLTRMTYFLYPQVVSYDILTKYPPTDTEVNLCAFVEYWLEYLYSSKSIDIQKDGIYLGFYSELFCYYPATNRSYMAGEPSSLTSSIIP